jgi:hypothetical protein
MEGESGYTWDDGTAAGRAFRCEDIAHLSELPGEVRSKMGSKAASGRTSDMFVKVRWYRVVQNSTYDHLAESGERFQSVRGRLGVRGWTALSAPARSWRSLDEVERTSSFLLCFLLTAQVPPQRRAETVERFQHAREDLVRGCAAL